MELQPPFFSLSSSLPHARKLLRPVWEQSAQLRQLQALLVHSRHLNGLDFVALLLRHLQISVCYDEAEVQRLPAGAFIAVASQPCSVLDSLVLLHVLGQARPQLRVVAAKLLAPLLPQLIQHLVPETPESQAAGRSKPDVRQMLRYLHNDVPLLLLAPRALAPNSRWFQAAPDSVQNFVSGWLLARARVPVVPLCLGRPRAATFTVLKLLRPLLGIARLPAELLDSQGQTIQVRIGQPVAPDVLNGLPSPYQLPYQETQIRALAASLGQLIAAQRPTLAVPAVLPETPAGLLEADIAALRPGRCLVRHGRWEVVLAKTEELPHMMREIGRLRELTRQARGESAAYQPTDLDCYDHHYRHLVLYDREGQQLVGACRLGLGRKILRQQGRHGFYSYSLFRLKKGLVPVLRQSVEVGCLVVRAGFQNQPLAVALLWKGIAEYLVTHPEYHYLLSSVAICNPLSAISKATMVQHLRRHFLDSELAAYVQPRKQFTYWPPATEADLEPLQANPDDSARLHQLVDELEVAGSKMPVLLQPYLQQNAQLLAFNTAPRSGNALCGLLLLDARALPACGLHLLSQ